MTRRALVLSVLVLAGLAVPAAAQEVYRWKDARGVTHYGDTPPPGVKATPFRTAAPPPRPAPQAAGAPGAAATAAAPPSATAQCTTARRNLELLQGAMPVGVDSNGDGKPDGTMDAAQRAAQVKLAEAGIAAYCSGVPAAPPKA